LRLHTIYHDGRAADADDHTVCTAKKKKLLLYVQLKLLCKGCCAATDMPHLQAFDSAAIGSITSAQRPEGLHCSYKLSVTIEQ